MMETPKKRKKRINETKNYFTSKSSVAIKYSCLPSDASSSKSSKNSSSNNSSGDSGRSGMMKRKMRSNESKATTTAVRRRLPQPFFFSMLIQALQQARQILVLVGAGISTNAGLPDFRSEQGLYSMIKEQLDSYQLPEPQCLFDLEYFQDDPGPFFQFAKKLLPGKFRPTLTHVFLKLLEDKKKLLRVYTQNIDGLEEMIGIKKVIYCHGTMRTARCLQCSHRVQIDDIRETIDKGEIPRCAKKNCANVYKPDITFFGEKLNSQMATSLRKDREKADLLLVIGTSLKVAPISDVPQFVNHSIPQVLINRETVSLRKHISEGFDIQLLGDCDRIVQDLCQQCGWTIQHIQHPTTGARLLRPHLTNSFDHVHVDNDHKNSSGGGVVCCYGSPCNYNTVSRN